MKELIENNRKIIDIMILIVVALILSIPLLNSFFYLYNNDGLTTIARAYEALKAIQKNGYFSQNVLISLSNNFGYAWSIFSGSLSTNLIMVFASITNNFIISYKISAIFLLMASGFTMYIFTYRATGERNIALLSSVLYLVFPYHLSTIYCRNNIEDLLVFTFLPVACLGLYNLINFKNNTILFAIGMAGILLSNTILFFCTAVYCVICLIVFRKSINREAVENLIINIILIVMLTSFFWLPNISARILGDYHVDNITKEELLSDTLNSGLSISQIFVTREGSYTVWELGPHIIIMLAFSWFAFKNMTKEYKKIYTLFLVLGLVTLVLSTKYIPWKFLPKLFLYLRPWKLMEFVCLLFSFVCGMNMYILIKNFNFKDVVIISGISMLYLVALVRFVPFEDNIKNISEYRLGIITGKENEYVKGMEYLSFLPEKAYNNRFYIAIRDDSIDTLEGDIEISNITKVGTKLTADIVAKSETNKLELPFIYYPGYEIRYDGMLVDSFETDNGFLGVELKKDEGKLEVNYIGTKEMKIGTIISAVTFGICMVLFIKKRWKFNIMKLFIAWKMRKNVI